MDVSFDDYLDIISVPILHIGAGVNEEAGYIISINMFFDQETHKTNIVLINREIVKTKFGKVKTLVFKPT